MIRARELPGLLVRKGSKRYDEPRVSPICEGTYLSSFVSRRMQRL
jgi:hypothetical protein